MTPIIGGDFQELAINFLALLEAAEATLNDIGHERCPWLTRAVYRAKEDAKKPSDILIYDTTYAKNRRADYGYRKLSGDRLLVYGDYLTDGPSRIVLLDEQERPVKEWRYDRYRRAHKAMAKWDLSIDKDPPDYESTNDAPVIPEPIVVMPKQVCR